MKDDRTVLVETSPSRSSGVWSIAIAAFVFITTIICAVIFSVYILNRIDSVEREVSLLLTLTYFPTLTLTRQNGLINNLVGYLETN